MSVDVLPLHELLNGHRKLWLEQYRIEDQAAEFVRANFPTLMSTIHAINPEISNDILASWLFDRRSAFRAIDLLCMGREDLVVKSLNKVIHGTTA